MEIQSLEGDLAELRDQVAAQEAEVERNLAEAEQLRVNIVSMSSVGAELERILLSIEAEQDLSFTERRRFVEEIQVALIRWRGISGQSSRDDVEQPASVLSSELFIATRARELGADTNQIAYILATARFETAYTLTPVRETLARSVDEAIERLEQRYSSLELPSGFERYWQRDSDGRSWMGRGYILLTHKANYERASERLGEDLVTDPERALEPAVAADILIRGLLEGWFTGRLLSDFISDEAADFLRARRTVGAFSGAETVAELAEDYRARLTEGDLQFY